MNQRIHTHSCLPHPYAPASCDTVRLLQVPLIMVHIRISGHCCFLNLAVPSALSVVETTVGAIMHPASW